MDDCGEEPTARRVPHTRQAASPSLEEEHFG